MLLALLLLTAGAASVHAQAAVKGAIRGTVYHDTNVDGFCGPGDPALAGVQIDFTHEGGQTVRLLTYSDGTYGLASIDLGTWQVTAWPLAGWVVTSQQPIVVMLTANLGKRHMVYARDLGVHAYLTKPVSLARLVDTIVDLLSDQPAESGKGA